jgi:xylono-1,5-lactonase
MEKLAEGFEVIEAPVWDPARGLLFSDAIKGGVFQMTPDGTVTQIIHHRRGIGGIALHQDGSLIVSGRNVARKRLDVEDGGGPTPVVLDTTFAKGMISFNDIGGDFAGRLYIGGVAFSMLAKDPPRPGALYRIDLDGSVRQIAMDPAPMLPNGMGFSPGGEFLYLADSAAHAVHKLELDSNGNIRSQTRFAEVAEGLPDGIAVAEDGSVWVAACFSSRVVVFEPDGQRRKEIEFPLPMVTSVCFGGDDLKDLYVVTGSHRSGRDDAGAVFRLRSGVAGLPTRRVRI